MEGGFPKMNNFLFLLDFIFQKIIYGRFRKRFI